MSEAVSELPRTNNEGSNSPSDVKQIKPEEISSDINVTPEGKNGKEIKCQKCPSTILTREMASLVTNEFTLPAINLKSEENKPTIEDNAKQYWCVENMYAFENVGFSNTVDGVKYLICADCEIGPIGWHDLDTKLSYVSLCRIGYC